MLRKEPDERPTMAEVAARLQEALPDYALSRKSLPPFRLEVSGATRLRDLELGTPDRGTPERGTPERGRPSKPPLEPIQPTIDQPGLSGVSSQSGTITGATGQAGPPVSRRRGGAVLLVIGLSLLSGVGAAGLALWHHRPPKARAALSQPATPTLAPTPTAPPPTPPPATPTPAVTPSGSTGKPTPATPTAGEPAVDAIPESDPDQKNRHDRAALKLGKRSKSKTPHATQIIN